MVFRKGFHLQGVEVANAMLVQAAPVNKGRFGDVQFGGDAGKGPTLSAKVDETFDNCGIFTVHGKLVECD